MRALASNAALRVLRTASSYKVSNSATSVGFRALCVNTPPVTSGTKPDLEPHPASVIDPLKAAVESVTPEEVSSNVAETVDSEPNLAGETTATIDTTPDLITEESSNQAAKFVDTAEISVDGQEFVSSTRGFDGGTRHQFDLSQFNSADELATYLKSIVNQSQMRAMLTFRAALEQEGTPLISKKSIGAVLPVMARNGWFQTTKDILALAEEKNIVLDTVLYNCALFAMTRTGELDAMKSVIEKMTELGKPCRPNVTSFNLLIASHFYRGNVDDGFGVLQDMKASGIYPSIATYQTLVSGCLRRRDYDRAYKTLLAIDQQAMLPSGVIVGQMLYFAAHNDHYEHVDALLSKLEQVMPTYYRDLENLVAKRSSNNPNETYLKESERGKPRLELSCFTAIFHCANRGARPDIAIRAWNMMAESYPELVMTSDHWYSLIGALAGTGNFEAAFDAIGHMTAVGLKPSVRSLSSILIRPLSEDVEKIDSIYYYLVERIEGKDISTTDQVNEQPAAVENVADDAVPVEESVEVATEDVSSSTASPDHMSANPDTTNVEEQFETSTTADLMASDVEGSAATSDEMQKEGHVSLSEAIGIGADAKETNKGPLDLPWGSKRRAEVGITELNCVIGACALAGDLDRAFQTYDEAIGDLGFTRDADTLNALLEGCVQARHIKGGARVIEEARADGTEMNMDTVHMTCRLYCRSNRGSDALALLREAAHADMPVAARTWSMLARHLARSGSFEESAECVELAVKQGYRETGIKPNASLLGPRENRRGGGGFGDDFARGGDEMETSSFDSDDSKGVKLDS